MSLPTTILLFANIAVFISVIRAVSADLQPISDEKCPYKDTIDLTDLQALDNGSYVYHNVIISHNKWADYNYTLGFRNVEWEAKTHRRGCVCGRPKKCVKLCCESGMFFNETSFECENIPFDLDMPTEIDVATKNGKKMVNILEHFVPLVGKPCKYLESLTMNVDRWELREHGSLHIFNDDTYLDTLSYCLSPYRYNGSDKYVLVAMSCPIKYEVQFSLLLNTYAMAISVLFLVPTVLVYLIVRELRANMRGKLLICYLISLIGGYSIIGFINISEYIFEEKTCSALGFTCYFFFMSAFLWLSVLCFDIWINFREHTVSSSKKQNTIRFLFYSLYAWGTASLLTVATVWAQWSPLVPASYKPGIGVEVCWLDTNKWAAAIYFYWPNLIIILINLVTFSNLSLRIYRVRRDVAKVTQRQKFFKEKFGNKEIMKSGAVILRLFIVMGISWIMDIISFCLRDYHVSDYLFMITDFCNAIQGVIIFILFVLKPNVYQAVRKCIGSSEVVKPKPSGTSATNYSKVTTSTTTA